MLAVENDSLQAVELIMRYGGDPFIKDKAGWDCRVIANYFCSRNVIQHFRKIGMMT